MGASAPMGVEAEVVPGIEVGSRVVVKKDVVVFHAPKIKELNLMGKEVRAGPATRGRGWLWLVGWG